ncbi:MAG: hypothetical protein OER86_07630 [Phycisphaerae bacterium]|nr:hypothetical protein [Phycisphaerae bacterium]
MQAAHNYPPTFAIALVLTAILAASGCSEPPPPPPTGPPKAGLRGTVSREGVKAELVDGVVYWMKDMREVWVYGVSRKMTPEERKKVESANMVVERMVPGAKIFWLPIVFEKETPAPTTFGIQDVQRYAVSYTNFDKPPHTLNLYANQKPLAEQGLLYLKGGITAEGGQVAGRFRTTPKLPSGSPDLTWDLEFSLPIIPVGN